PMAPGLGFAFGFEGRDYLDKALHNGWLITDDGQTSPAVWSRTKEVNLEANFELFKGFKVQITMNRTDNRTSQIQFMYGDMPTSYSGSFTMTGCAIGTSLGSSGAGNGYASAAFDNFLNNIGIMRNRVEGQYIGKNYPETGFMQTMPMAGQPYSPEVGTVSETSSDVLIPAFVSAYTKRNPRSQWLSPFPSFSAVLPNWRITYDGLINLGNLRDIFKTFTLSHAYQCTYSVGSYSSYLNWVSVDGDRLGFTLDELTGNPVPSSPFNISSVAITERFAPLIGANVTLKNDLQLGVEYRDQRTLTLNSSAGQVVEATTRGFKFSAGYKIVGFNTVLKMKGSQQGVSNDLTLNAEVGIQQNQALIRRIENSYTQPTSGTNSFNINFTASYILSKRVTVSAYFDHQANSPIVTTSAYPTTNTSYGLSLNLSLAR
ncbi:MAG: cell surface protein SprA, partial [Muribaculaceae bacterium]|nr:cell surface protein SprA [Muribaculaceae bacterium]